MKLFRFGPPQAEKPGVVLNNGQQVDVSAYGQDYDESFWLKGGPARLEAWLKEHAASCPAVDLTQRLASPVKSPSKIICIGLNYSDHALETKASPPSEPIVFFKSTTALNGPNDPVVIPKHSAKTDWEVELAVVVGRRASYVEEAQARAYIGGYLMHNDYSERAFQIERGGQWVKGKSCDTFAPLGPYLVTPDQIGDVDNLRLWLRVNGKTMQDGNTKNLIFKVPFLIAYLSQFMTLLPGDIITTGTPAGVGLGQKPEPWYLRPGDVVELGIDGLGTARQALISYEQWSAERTTT